MGGRGASSGRGAYASSRSTLPDFFDLNKRMPKTLTESQVAAMIDSVPDGTSYSIDGTPMSFRKKNGEWVGAFGEKISRETLISSRNQGKGISFEHGDYFVREDWRKKNKRK